MYIQKYVFKAAAIYT